MEIRRTASPGFPIGGPARHLDHDLPWPTTARQPCSWTRATGGRQPDRRRIVRRPGRILLSVRPAPSFKTPRTHDTVRHRYGLSSIRGRYQITGASSHLHHYASVTPPSPCRCSPHERGGAIHGQRLTEQSRRAPSHGEIRLMTGLRSSPGRPTVKRVFDLFGLNAAATTTHMAPPLRQLFRPRRRAAEEAEHAMIGRRVLRHRYLLAERRSRPPDRR